jgi:hypothetical protein
LGAGAYAELVSIVAAVSAIDAFCEALGRGHEPLPEPDGGSCHAGQAKGASDIGGYLPMVDPWEGPNVSRALSLVPSANELFMNNVRAM